MPDVDPIPLADDLTTRPVDRRTLLLEVAGAPAVATLSAPTRAAAHPARRRHRPGHTPGRFGGRLPRLAARARLALLPILVIGGLAFVIDSGALSAVLTVSLFLLLLWVAAASVTAARVASRLAAPEGGARPPGTR